MTGTRAGLSAVLMIAAAVAMPSVWAAEGRIPIFEQTTISVSGSYVVTRDIAAAGPAIDVLASAETVEIDLNGFKLSSTNGSTVLQANGLTSFRVRNGSIERAPGSFFYSGLIAQDVSRVVVENTRFDHATIVAQNSDSVTVRRSEFNNGGINIDDPAPAEFGTATIEDNVITEGLIFVQGATGSYYSVAVRNNRIKGGGSAAIIMNGQLGCVISDNRIGEHDGAGISLYQSSDCRISNNVIEEVGRDGIFVNASHRNKIVNNVFNNCGQNPQFAHEGNGISIAGNDNHLVDNLAQNNLLAGIYIRGSQRTTYSGNVASQNGANPPGAPCANPAITTCPAPYGTGSAAPDLCDDGTNSKTFCDNMLPGPPRS